MAGQKSGGTWLCECRDSSDATESSPSSEMQRISRERCSNEPTGKSERRWLVDLSWRTVVCEQRRTWKQREVELATLTGWRLAYGREVSKRVKMM